MTTDISDTTCTLMESLETSNTIYVKNTFVEGKGSVLVLFLVQVALFPIQISM